MLHKQVEALDQNSEQKRGKKNSRASVENKRKALQCPRKKQGGDHYGWRSASWRCHLTVATTAPVLDPLLSYPFSLLFSSRLVRRLFSVVCSEEKNTNGQQIPKPNCTLLLVLVLLSTENHCIQYCKATLLSFSTSENLPRKLFFFHISVQKNLAGATVALGL